MKPRDLLVLTGLGAIRGASFVFMKVSTPYLGPFTTVWLRVTVATLVLLMWFFVRGKKICLRGAWRKMFFLGTINTAIPFILIATSTLVLPVSTVAIIIATAPLFTVIMEGLFLKKPIERNHFLAAIFGSVGIVILLRSNRFSFTHQEVLAILMALGATLFAGIGSVFMKTNLMEHDREVLAYGQQIGAVFVLFPLIFIQPPVTWHVPLGVWVSVVALGVFCTEIASLIYYSLIQRIGPSKILVVTFMVPFFGILWGVVFLKETLFFGTVFGFGLILLGLMMLYEVQLIQAKSKVRS